MSSANNQGRATGGQGSSQSMDDLAARLLFAVRNGDEAESREAADALLALSAEEEGATNLVILAARARQGQNVDDETIVVQALNELRNAAVVFDRDPPNDPRRRITRSDTQAVQVAVVAPPPDPRRRSRRQRRRPATLPPAPPQPPTIDDDGMDDDDLLQPRRPVPQWTLVDAATRVFTTGLSHGAFDMIQLQQMATTGQISQEDFQTVLDTPARPTRGSNTGTVIAGAGTGSNVPTTRTRSGAAASNNASIPARVLSTNTTEPLRPGNVARPEYLGIETRDTSGDPVMNQYRPDRSVTMADWRSSIFCTSVNRWRQQILRRTGVTANVAPRRYSQTEHDWLEARIRAQPNESYDDLTAAFNAAMAAVPGMTLPPRTVIGLTSYVQRNEVLCKLKGINIHKKPTTHSAMKEAEKTKPTATKKSSPEVAEKPKPRVLSLRQSVATQQPVVEDEKPKPLVLKLGQSVAKQQPVVEDEKPAPAVLKLKRSVAKQQPVVEDKDEDKDEDEDEDMDEDDGLAEPASKRKRRR